MKLGKSPQHIRGKLIRISLPYIQEIDPGYFRIRRIIDDFVTKIEFQSTEKSLKR